MPLLCRVHFSPLLILIVHVSQGMPGGWVRDNPRLICLCPALTATVVVAWGGGLLAEVTDRFRQLCQRTIAKGPLRCYSVQVLQYYRGGPA